MPARAGRGWNAVRQPLRKAKRICAARCSKCSRTGSGFAVLKQFTNYLEGAGSYAGLALSGNVLYGTTGQGGGPGHGTVFKINTDGTGYNLLKKFNDSDGADPETALTLSGSTIFGTTSLGGTSGYGTVFKLNTDGTGFVVVLKHFSAPDPVAYTNSGGAVPFGSLTLSSNLLYGTTSEGGNSAGGTIFKMNTDGTSFTVLKEFNLSDGALAYAALTLSGSVLYGTTAEGGSAGNGTVFKINTDGSGFEVLKEFSATSASDTYTNSDGAFPCGSLVLSSNVLYGTTYGGGSSGAGTVFAINTNGLGFALLKDFSNADGALPFAGLTLSSNVLYGTTAGGASDYGSVFKLNTDGASFTLIKEFGYSDGREPLGSLALSSNVLYGATWAGGSGDRGTLFKLNTDGTGYTPCSKNSPRLVRVTLTPIITVLFLMPR